MPLTFLPSARWRPAAPVRVLAFALALWAGIVPAPARTLRLVHAEDFSRAADLDRSFWSVETGLFRNHEAQSYQPRNVAVAGGLLTIEARRERAVNAAYRADGRDWPETVQAADYTSGSIVTREAFTFGVVEVVARLPGGAGPWPAIWLIFEQGRPYREIDMVEAVGSAPGTIFSTVSAGPELTHLRNWKAETPVPTLASAFHTYRLDWRPDALVMAIDGRPVLRMDPEAARTDLYDPLRSPMHLRINLALGGSWGGRIDDAALPARLDVRSVRIWRWEER